MIRLKNLIVEQESTDPQETVVGGYQTKHYDVCPGAQTLYKDIESKVDNIDLATRAAKLQDALFAIEKNVLQTGANNLDVEAAVLLAGQIMAMAKMMGLEKEHAYIQGHIDKIKSAVK